MSEELRKTFAQEIEELRRSILEMGAAAEELIENSVRSLITRDAELADSVITGDEDIDDMELEIEGLCLRLLALQQPMAIDLRIISGALKIITDIERLADHATKIAKMSKILTGMPQLKPYVDLPRMAATAIEMLKLSLDAFTRLDIELAQAVIAMDDRMDEYNHSIFAELVEFMREDGGCVPCVTHLLAVVHSLERIADHVTNICERVIFIATGALP